LSRNKTLKAIKEKIDNSSDGYIYFDEFMEIALYSPFGYFNSGEIRSTKRGDFLTSPEVSSYFGKIIHQWIISVSSNKTLDLLELGPGSGSLASSINTEVKNKEVNYSFLEKSESAISSLSKAFPQSDIKKSIDELSFTHSDNLVVIGNEILDNIPCSIGLVQDSMWKEKAIQINEGELSYCFVKPRDNVMVWLTDYYKEEKPDYEVEVQIQAELFISNIIKKFNPSNIVLFDYGYLQDERASRPYKSLLRTYKDHHLGPDPLLYPGQTDITYDINFSSLLLALQDIGGYDVQLSTQYEFLYKHGLNNYINELIEKRSSEEGVDLVKTNSDLLGLATISDENGLGGFYTIESTRK
tara:strand:- start:3217 stop:4281 length:1065 start_codon:yes stop_codon:yes gene_type:complete